MKLEVSIRKPLHHFELDVCFEMDDGLGVIFGRSGVGKTQTLECIAGLSKPSQGLIRLGGRMLYCSDPGKRRVDMPPRQRRIGYVFQDGLLFPHMTIRRNVMYPLERLRAEPGDGAWVLKLLEELEIGHLADLTPDRLSGGQRRRSAIARALAARPELLLMDEPFVHLDRVVKAKLMAEVERISREFGVPVLVVTHDLDVVTRLAAQIVVLEQGRVVQSGARDAVLDAPASSQVAKLFGDVNVLEGRVAEFFDGLWSVEAAGHLFRVAHVGHLEKGQKVELLVRSGAIKLIKPDTRIPPDLCQNLFDATVLLIERGVDAAFVTVELEAGAPLVLSTRLDRARRAQAREGARCRVAVLVEGIVLLP